MISQSVKELLFLPDYYTDEYNATPMKNYWPFLEKIVNVFDPTSVCEVGSERGLTSQLLVEKFKGIEKIYIVDPSISDVLKQNKTEYTSLHEETSLEFLARGLDIDLYFLDGDHNYYTVLNELRLIEKNRKDASKKMILLHDVSWFCGRRDQYYNPDLIPEKLEYYDSGAICLESASNVKYGFRLDKHFAVAKKYGGEHNGVLTAIEDFIEQSSLPWKFKYIPSLWGLGFLWLEEGLDAQQNLDIAKIIDTLDDLKEFFGILEANRLRLLQGLNEWQGAADEKEKEIERLSCERDELYAIAEARLSERNELYDIAEKRLAELQRLGEERNSLYEVAEMRLKELNKLLHIIKARENELQTIKNNVFYKILKKLKLV